jgi:TPR repeat protein
MKGRNLLPQTASVFLLTAGMMLLPGKELFAQGKLPSVEQLTPLAKKNDNTAQYQLGMCYELGIGVPIDQKEAVRWYTRAAKTNPDAMHQLGFLEAFGVGTAKPDDKEAMKWFLKAGELGHVQAQYKAAYYYERGLGVKAPDLNEAFKWYKKAADQNVLEAQLQVGRMFQNGQGTGQDYAEAARWFRKAADAGYAPAQYALGSCYSLGQGVARDYVEAYKWLVIAANTGSDDAARRRDSMVTLYKMTPEQVSEGQKRALAYKK